MCGNKHNGLQMKKDKSRQIKWQKYECAKLKIHTPKTIKPP